MEKVETISLGDQDCSGYGAYSVGMHTGMQKALILLLEDEQKGWLSPTERASAG